MSERIVDLPNGGAADEYTRLHGAKTLYGYDLHEEIVRCRDCEHFDEIIHACNHPNISALRGDVPENWILSMFDMDFCSYGKPRDEP